jgi:hypothetical protein
VLAGTQVEQFHRAPGFSPGKQRRQVSLPGGAIERGLTPASGRVEQDEQYKSDEK